MAARGSFWFSVQWILNKVVAAGAMVLIVNFVSPEAYGIAVTALAIAAYLKIANPEVLCKVLLAHTRHVELFASAGRRLSWWIGAAGTVLTLAAIPFALRIYDGFPPQLLGILLAALAVFHLLSAALVVPMTELQRTLQFRKIAVLEGTVQFAASVLSVTVAAVGGGAASLVLPQIVKEGVRAIWYRQTHQKGSDRRFHSVAARVLLRDYSMVAAGAYLHGSFMGLAVLFLGLLSGEYEAGLFGFGFTLAIQMTRVLTAKIGVVLQSIFANIRDDYQRQIDGLLRAQRVLGAVCVPLALTQAILAAPFFQLVLPAKWGPAVPVLQLLSITQAFHFTSSSSMAGLTAQRRFGTVAMWQGVQMALAIPIYWWAAAHGAVSTAIVSAAMWAVSAPIGTWLCVRIDGRPSTRRIMNVFLRPWLVSGPLFGIGYAVVVRLMTWGTAGAVISVAVVGPALALAAFRVSWVTDEDFRSVGKGMIGWVRKSTGAR